MLDSLTALRAALQVSPDNIPLRQHIADLLLSHGQAELGEQEYRKALEIAPQQPDLLFGLARAYYLQGKDSQGIVILDAIVQAGSPDAAWLTLQARFLLRGGDTRRAIEQLTKAITIDPSVRQSDLAEQLGLDQETPIRVANENNFDALLDRGKEIERPKLCFSDVGGMEALKEEIRLKIIYPLTHADMYRAYGKKIGGGILMYGPPGCGKTHLARATAGEIQAGFIAVGINDVLDMWLGNSERNLHDVFAQARRNTPCVLFFDEVDALAASRSDLRQSAGRNLINQFLAELDGVQYANEGVLILAATNAPWHIDSAFRRPGRFDRILFVPPPDIAGRTQILRLLCQGKPVEDLDFSGLAKRCDGYSGADLQAVIDVAIERKLQEAMKTGHPKPLITKDLMGAIATVRPSTREWFSSAKNYAVHANQDGTYDDIMQYLKL
jgi:transitional endoplasmic reticulum ATPase